jgi:hypothetical protein
MRGWEGRDRRRTGGKERFGSIRMPGQDGEAIIILASSLQFRTKCTPGWNLPRLDPFPSHIFPTSPCRPSLPPSLREVGSLGSKSL